MTETASARVEPVVVQAEPALVARAPQKPLFWSAAASASAAEVQDSAQSERSQSNQGQSEQSQSDESHVPLGLRHLKKCEACGFPITAGRSLCVECEEKRWRGQLRRPPVGAPLATPAAPKPTPRPTVVSPTSGAAAALAPSPETKTAPPIMPEVKANQSKDLAETSPTVGTVSVIPGQNDAPVVSAEKAVASASPVAPVASSPEVVFSAGLQSSQSWFAANKYILGALLVVAGVVTGILLLR